VKNNSAVSGFHKLSPADRLSLLKSLLDLSEEEIRDISSSGAISLEKVDMLIENVIGVAEIPIGIATYFLINGKDYMIPMAIEEASVVAACSNGAKIARLSGGFTGYSTKPIMIGQVQILDLESPEAAVVRIMLNKDIILKAANEKSKTLRENGSGAKDLECRIIGSYDRMLIVHILVDVMDAMGANIVNSMCEHISPMLEEITGGRVNLRILSNLSIHRRSYATAVFKKEAIGGENGVERILEAYRFADLDMYRAATHNKGIMNGVDAVLLATMNDWRAVEAGAHAFASIGGYHSLTKYSKNSNGDLVGSIELPLAVGIVGGSTVASPKATVAKKILDVRSAGELGFVLASVGLAQNFSAIRALANEGIQKGHMKLHARNIAISAGSPDRLIETVVDEMVKSGDISPSNAKRILAGLEKK
jgi:hydroxymethylglutaryl-CoA reductase